jgi:hypothetical protein
MSLDKAREMLQTQLSAGSGHNRNATIAGVPAGGTQLLATIRALSATLF